MRPEGTLGAWPLQHRLKHLSVGLHLIDWLDSLYLRQLCCSQQHSQQQVSRFIYADNMPEFRPLSTRKTDKAPFIMVNLNNITNPPGSLATFTWGRRGRRA